MASSGWPGRSGSIRAPSRELTLPPEPLGEEGERLLEPLVQLDPRRPAQHALRLVDAHGRSLLLTRTDRRELNRHAGAGAFLQRRCELDHRRLHPGTDVEPARIEPPGSR